MPSIAIIITVNYNSETQALPFLTPHQHQPRRQINKVRTGAFILLLVASTATPLLAAPWLDPGDPRARHALQQLVDHGTINLTTTTWPIMWPDIDRELDAARERSVTADARTYLRFEQGRQSRRGVRAESRISLASDSNWQRSFDSSLPRDEATASLDLEWQGNAWAAGMQPTFVLSGDDPRDLHIDGSYIAGTVDNWVIGLGNLNRWWGPGWHSTLAQSNNATPVSSVWFNRRLSSPGQGGNSIPWSITGYIGTLSEDRLEGDANTLGFRGTVRPLTGLELGITRQGIFGGDAGVSGLSGGAEALIGSADDDEAYQFTALDFRYGLPFGQNTVGVYGQILRQNDESDFFDLSALQAGIDATTQQWGGQQQWYLEWTDTTLNSTVYEHPTYTTGFRHRGRTMGASQGPDSQTLTLGGYHFLSDGRNLGAAIQAASLNVSGDASAAQASDQAANTLLAGPQEVLTFSASYGLPLLSGWATLHGRVHSQPIERAAADLSDIDPWYLGADWRYRF